MKHLTVLFTVLAASAAGNINNRIIGGVETTIQEHPYQVSIQTKFGVHICGGSIVKVDRILSAAHCFAFYLLIPLQARAGSTTLGNSGGTVHPVESKILHPQFNKVNLDFDVAVLTLKEPIVISLSASPIPLVPSKESSPRVGEMVNVTGWGSTSHQSREMSHILRVVRVPVIDRAQCEKVYRNYIAKVTPRMFCAMGKNQGPYMGDSGGPIVNGKGQVVGIVSWGRIGDINGWPAVYTDLTSEPIRSFVDKNIA